MRFRYYAIIAFGNTDGIREMIKEISETKPRVLQQDNVLISTFSTNWEPSELESTFDGDRRTFFIFEVNEETSAFKIGREEIQEQLFGYIKNGGDEVVRTKSNSMENAINGKVSGETEQIIEEEVIDVTKLTKKEKEDKIDELLDKGLNTLDKEDKDLLDLLTKNT